MTNEEYKKLTQDYMEAFHEYDIYMEQFFTSYTDGQLTSAATKIFTDDEIKKTDEMRSRLDKLEQLWFSVAKGEILVKN